jgi:aldehyde dehydrogenase (NAD+)
VRFKNLIAGQWVDASSGETFDNVNPADTTDIIGQFPLSTAVDVDRAVASAKRGFEVWRATPAPLRGDVMRRAGDILAARKEEIAELMTREMGKPLAETRHSLP